MVLVLEFLKENGYLKSMELLQTESAVSLMRFAAADNVDLMTILQVG